MSRLSEEQAREVGMEFLEGQLRVGQMKAGQENLGFG